MANLSARLGGLSLLSHAICSPHAYTADVRLSDAGINLIFEMTSTDEVQPRSKEERCRKVSRRSGNGQ